MAQRVKNPPASARDAVQSEGREDPLGEEMTTHSSVPAWRIPWTEEPGGLQSMGVAKSQTQQRLSTPRMQDLHLQHVNS